MGEELRNLIRDRIQATELAMDDLEIGTKERTAAMLEIERLTKLLNEDYKTVVAAETAKTEAETEIKKSRLDILKAGITAVVTGISGWFGVKTVYKMAMKAEADGVIPNREITKHLPRIKFW